MMTIENSTTAEDEPKSTILETRLDHSEMDMIACAGILRDVEGSSYVECPADDAAQATIESHKVTVLESEADRRAFFEALEHPPRPNDRLKQAFALRKQLITNAD